MALLNGRRRLAAVITGTVLALGGPAAAGLAAAHAGSRDADRDGIPSRWERNHGMRPFYAADARADFDRDGLRNLDEYRQGGLLRDEDTDNDGHDDGDEVKDGFRSTDIRDADTDNDGERDGDEDADRDRVDNEDEDDAREVCQADDDDRDGDDVSDEDENELGLSATDADRDNDGVLDGDEDGDHDGEANEDEDDVSNDSCSGDSDRDGESDEDETDRLGTIASFDGSTLVVTTAAGNPISGVVTTDTEVEFEDSEDTEATTADLQPGVVVAELEFDDETGAIEEIEIYQNQA
jgi:hypothetical protein